MQKADLASSVRNFFETRDRFKKPNFFLLELPYRNIFSGITRFYFAIFELHLGYLHKVSEKNHPASCLDNPVGRVYYKRREAPAGAVEQEAVL